MWIAEKENTVFKVRGDCLLSVLCAGRCLPLHTTKISPQLLHGDTRLAHFPMLCLEIPICSWFANGQKGRRVIRGGSDALQLHQGTSKAHYRQLKHQKSWS